MKTFRLVNATCTLCFVLLLMTPFGVSSETSYGQTKKKRERARRRQAEQPKKRQRGQQQHQQQSENKMHQVRVRTLSTVPTFEYKMYDGACRIDNGYAGEKDKDYVRHAGKTLQECQDMCSVMISECLAFEFARPTTTSSTGSCEIWFTKPDDYQPINGRIQCYHKDIKKKKEPDYEKCEEVHRRPIYGTGDDDPVTIASNENHVRLVKLYSPFGSDAQPPLQSGYERWYRLYAEYWDQEHPEDLPPSQGKGKGKKANLEVKFDFRSSGKGDVKFKLPQIGETNTEYRGDGYSDSHQFVDSIGLPCEINRDDAEVYLEFKSSANNIPHDGKVYWIVLVAYDCMPN